MQQTPLRAGAFVAGGLALGVWLFLGLFQTKLFTELGVHSGLWWFWGVVGFVVAGGIFATRATHDVVRIVVWVGLGIAIGMLLGTALFNQVGEATAALFTAIGGGLIVTALPSMQPEQPAAPQPNGTHQDWIPIAGDGPETVDVAPAVRTRAPRRK